MVITEFRHHFESIILQRLFLFPSSRLHPPPPFPDKTYGNIYLICIKLHVKILNNYWMRSSRIWGIIKAEVCVICRSRRLRQITQTEALIIPHILRGPNSIIVLLFICICQPFSWRSHLYFKFLHKQYKPFVFCIWHKQHKLVWRHKVV